ncbi:MAG: NAD(P)-dependent oxidoreductase [Anaerolineae bacterium]|nr:NAD(P)-dependent oxidoreductase [Anaerolineae bacterium]
MTGGNGRVGQTVIQVAREQGHKVVSIDRSPPASASHLAGLAYIQADLTDYAAFEQAITGCDALIHLAAIPHPRTDPDYVVHHNNVVSSYNALSAAARLGIWRVCQASSINAVGAAFSRQPRFDYLPLDEQHPTYNEDAYSLSKWLGEQQADSFARRYKQMTIASLRIHWAVPDRETVAQRRHDPPEQMAKELWGYTERRAAARAFLAGVTADFTGHEAFYIVAPETLTAVPSPILKEQFYPDVPLHGSLSGHQGFFNCAKAERLLGWRHDEA